MNEQQQFNKEARGELYEKFPVLRYVIKGHDVPWEVRELIEPPIGRDEKLCHFIFGACGHFTFDDFIKSENPTSEEIDSGQATLSNWVMQGQVEIRDGRYYVDGFFYDLIAEWSTIDETREGSYA